MRSLLATLAVLIIAVPSLAAEFVHGDHLTYLEDAPCSTCHVEGAQSIKPDTKVCLECHDEDFIKDVTFPGLLTHGPVWAMNHRPFAKGNKIDCYACHQQVDCLECHKSGFADEQGSFGNAMINVHQSDFYVTHPIPARTDPQLCSSCHENKFCRDCHDDFAPQDLRIRSHRKGWSDIELTDLGTTHDLFTPDMCQTCHPDSVLPSHEWSSTHAKEARKNLVTCQACHPDGDICLQCHSAKSGLMINPHPDDWNDIKGRLKNASDGKTCRRCH